jgi:hypothetical protein
LKGVGHDFVITGEKEITENYELGKEIKMEKG